MPLDSSQEISRFKTSFDDISVITKKHKEILGAENEFIKLRDALYEKSNIERDKQRLKHEKMSAAEREKLERSVQKRINAIENKAAQQAQVMFARNLAQRTEMEKLDILKNSALKKKEASKHAQEELAALELLAETGSKRDKQRYEKKRKEVAELEKAEAAANKAVLSQQQKANSERYKKKRSEIAKLARSRNADDKKEAKQRQKQLQQELKKEYDQKKDNQKKLSKELRTLRKSGASEEEIAAKEAELNQAKQEASAAGSELNSASIETALNEFADAISSAYNNAYKQAENIVTSSQSRVNAALQGSDKNFQDMMDLVTDNLSLSPLVKMEDVISSIKEASDKGIVYNIEQRSFLNTVAEKIAHTFDAFDSNLLRLIRLQQADTTAARLGMEASLTKLFNSTFNDSSYLNDMYDTVSQAIIDANSQMSRDESAAFEYTLQKWMGSLYSLGLSGDAITQIAQGVNYLATGDVTSLASNTSLQTLMAMSASNAGLDFAQIMLDGLDASTTNQLLESMVKYLKDIAENSDNQVVKSAYGDILNMSLSDMRAFSNMTSSDISRISGTNMNYSGMMSETSNQLTQMLFRSSLAENMNTLYENAMFGMAMDMASNPATWAMDKILKFMNENNIDMNIPFISVFGSGLDLNASVVDLLQMGLGFSKAFSLVGNILGGIGSRGGTNLGAWGGTEYNQRGTGIGNLLGTMIGGTSSSTYVANSSSSDMSNDAIATATDDAAETEKITNKNAAKNDHTLDDFWNATVGESASDYLKVQDVLLFAVYENGRLRTTDYGIELVRNNDFLRVQDNNTAFLSYLTFDATRALRTVVTNSSITARIANASDIANAVRQSQPQSMAIAGTVNINKSTLVNAIIEALGGSENNIKLKQFIDGSLQNSNGNTPPTFKVKNEDGRDLNVRVSNYQLFNT